MSEDNGIYMMNEVAMPGVDELGIDPKNLTSEEVCKKCGKRKSQCTCEK